MKSKLGKKLVHIFMGLAVLVGLLVVGISVYFLTEPIGNIENTFRHDFAVGLVSILVSFLALGIAFFTLSSIDWVNKISTLDGNVLENKSYGVQSHIIVENYRTYPTRKSFEEKIEADLKFWFEDKKPTSLEFTDAIQNTIDLLLWFAYFDHRPKSYEENIESWVKKIRKMNNRVKKVTDGTRHIIDESINLIDYGLNYQANTSNSKSKTMIEIRWQLLVNPVARILCLDYTGLQHFRIAREKLVELCGNENNLFSQECMDRIMRWESSIQENNSSEEYIEARDEAYHFLMFHLNQSINFFNQATEISDGDILWNSYLKGNICRVKIVIDLINMEYASVSGSNYSGTKDELDRQVLLNEAVCARKNVLFEFNISEDFSEKGPTYLEAQFIREYYYTKSIDLASQVFFSYLDENGLDRNDANDLQRDLIDLENKSLKLCNMIRDEEDILSDTLRIINCALCRLRQDLHNKST